MAGMCSNVGNIGTGLHSRWLFAQLCQKLQCYSSLLPLEHIALSIHIGQPEPRCVWLSLLYFDGPITSKEIFPAYEEESQDVGESLTLAETWNDFKLEDKILQCLRCKQMCHCIPVTLKAGILLKVKQSPDDVDKSSYYWLYSVKSQLVNVHPEVQLKAFTVSPSILPAKRKTAEDPQQKYWHSLNLGLYLTALS